MYGPGRHVPLPKATHAEHRSGPERRAWCQHRSRADPSVVGYGDWPGDQVEAFAAPVVTPGAEIRPCDKQAWAPIHTSARLSIQTSSPIQLWSPTRSRQGNFTRTPGLITTP